MSGIHSAVLTGREYRLLFNANNPHKIGYRCGDEYDEEQRRLKRTSTGRVQALRQELAQAEIADALSKKLDILSARLNVEYNTKPTAQAETPNFAAVLPRFFDTKALHKAGKNLISYHFKFDLKLIFSYFLS